MTKNLLQKPKRFLQMRNTVLLLSLLFFAFQANAQNYCIPQPSVNSLSLGIYINSFTTSGGETNISNTNSGFSASGYGNFSATHSVSQYAGESISFWAVPGENLYYNKGLRVWVDWDKDGTFATNEIVYTSPSTIRVTHYGSFTVPAAVVAGNYRMRVIIPIFQGWRI